MIRRPGTACYNECANYEDVWVLLATIVILLFFYWI